MISELHAGAPFAMVAAQFSQTQTALEGGEIGWVQTNQLDPAVARLVSQMPVGAISNPVRVPGGLSIVTLQGKREIGHDIATVATHAPGVLAVHLAAGRSAEPDRSAAPGPGEGEVGRSARSMAASRWRRWRRPTTRRTARSIRGKSGWRGSIRRPSAQLLETIPLGKPTEPLISRDGIAVITVCSREQKNVGEITAQDIQHRLVS